MHLHLHIPQSKPAKSQWGKLVTILQACNQAPGGFLQSVMMVWLSGNIELDHLPSSKRCFGCDLLWCLTWSTTKVFCHV